MTLMDPIGDMFTRIRNGQMRSLNTIDVPASTFRQSILDILKNEGFINNYLCILRFSKYLEYFV